MFIWEFFEELDEVVYVSDIETNELVYMNAHLRNSLGYCSHEEYIGKKCYEVLQGCSSCCSFCTNHALQPGKFISWAHKNPVLNKNFLIKDSLFLQNGRRYRIEFAIDTDIETINAAPYYYARSETILNECLQQVFSTMDPEESIDKILAYIGKTFLCDRAYIFEIEDADMMSNTYEWCKQGIVAQKDILQQESIDGIDWWIKKFQKNQVVVIEDLESIRTQHPVTYALLKPQDISSLAVGPIHVEDKVLGFIGVDNPNVGMMNLITPLLNIIGYFMISLFKRRDLLKRLNDLSFHDPLTGAFNRNAMSEHHVNHLDVGTVGVIYCDITGLKRTNDTMGHDAGDQMIRYCYNLIHKTLETDWIYRTGGDEFVSVFPNCNEEDFHKIVEKLRNCIKQDKYHIAVGYAWSDQQPLNLETLISEADKTMYQDKRRYYAGHRMIPGIDRRYQRELARTDEEVPQSPFNQFISTSYCDVESLFQSISQQNSSGYFYFGDMQKEVFYISDNMRNEFGFESNIVPGMLRKWAQRISTPKFREQYWQELNDMIQNKRTVHNLRYQVRNINGKNIWIHCYGLLKWNKDKTMPLFFSGRITHQDNEFVVDPVTNFPRVSAVFGHLNKMQADDEQEIVIGFSLNNITEINNTRGRSYADRLLKNIADSLMEKLSDKISFYRLEGMRCIALVDSGCLETGEELIGQIRSVIEECYKFMRISVPRSCSFCLIKYPHPSLPPENFQDHIVSLLRVAKHEVNKPYIEYSAASIQRIKAMSNVALTLNKDVLNGMEHFRIMIQPMISTKDNKIIGGEVLLRWTFEGKDVSPAIFISMLEKGDMIHSVGRWVFDQAVRSCIRLITYIPDFYLTFNVSLQQLTDTSFTEFMKETLDKYHLSGEHIIAEMTESCLDEQPEKLNHFVKMCKKMGIGIALDDFGSGYSSLRMLLRYPCNIIKLDRSLVQEITESSEKLQFIRSIVYACHQFGKKVCVEGVENQEQNAIIQDTGCDMIQGYYYYRPMEVADLYRFLGEL